MKTRTQDSGLRTQPRTHASRRARPDTRHPTPDTRADLHLHTTYSDGALTPAQLVDLCAGRGLELIAITDHNTTDGVAEAQAAATRYAGLQVIPGVELSTSEDGVHILGYFRDCESSLLRAELARIRAAQRRSLQQTVLRLQALGLQIEWERVQALAGGSIGRRHIAQALLEAGQVASIDEAFDRYLGRSGFAWTPMMETPEPAAAVELIRQAGGVAVLAHPYTVPNLSETLGALTTRGLCGMEVYCAGADAAEIAGLRGAAESFRLLPLGGSDFHAAGGRPPREPSGVCLPVGAVQQLLHRLSKPALVEASR